MKKSAMNVRQRIADFVCRAFLLQINRKVNKVLGDGNCLFRALSEQTTGTSGKHAELRTLLLAFEEMNPQIFQPLVYSNTRSTHNTCGSY